LRKTLKEKSALGEHGASVIRREMLSMNCPFVPALRTINLILKRNGCVDRKSRIRYKAPPLGWYLPEVAKGNAELDSYDYVEDLRLAGKQGFINIFNVNTLHGGLLCSFPLVRMTADNTVFSLLQHWKQFGCPTYAQFDNSSVFTSSYHPHGLSIGKIRLCLSLDVIPVFAPPRETGFQANVERYNGLWERGVWERFHFKNKQQQLIEQSKKYVEAFHNKKYDSIISAPDRPIYCTG
jgi:hypothetical protein